MALAQQDTHEVDIRKLVYGRGDCLSLPQRQRIRRRWLAEADARLRSIGRPVCDLAHLQAALDNVGMAYLGAHSVTQTISAGSISLRQIVGWAIGFAAAYSLWLLNAFMEEEEGEDDVELNIGQNASGHG